MTIGILKESTGENRVVMLPEAVAALVKMKTNVLVETGSGERAFALTLITKELEQSRCQGRTLSKDQMLSLLSILLIMGILAEMKEGQIIIAVLNPFFNTALVKELASTNITSFSLELLPRTTRAQSMDILSSQATVAGYKAAT